MKEYLSKDYKLQKTSDMNTLCEIPDGAIALATYNNNKNGYWFNAENKYKGFGGASHLGNFGDDDVNAYSSAEEFANCCGGAIVWRRGNLKEYLNPSDWSLHMVDVDNDAAGEDWIKLNKDTDYLVKMGNDKLQVTSKDIDRVKSSALFGRVLWQRHTQPEELPFIDDEPKTVNATLAERQSQYGSFKEVAGTTQYLLQMLSTDEMSDVQLEAMHMICSKLSRIAHGDINHIDSWHDIAGYATLVVNDLNGADK